MPLFFPASLPESWLCYGRLSFPTFKHIRPHQRFSPALLAMASHHAPVPNHALQRTEAGGGLFLAFRVCPRQPLPLSLVPLGASSCIVK